MADMKSWYGLGKKCDNTMDKATHCAEWGGWIDSYFPIVHNLFMWRHVQSFPAVANRIDNWKILTHLRRQAISSVSAVCPQQQLVYGGVAREGSNFSSISDQISSLLFNAMLGLCLYCDISYFVWSYALIDKVHFFLLPKCHSILIYILEVWCTVAKETIVWWWSWLSWG